MIDIDKIAKRDALEVKEISELAKKFIIELNGEQSQFEIEEVMFEKSHWLVTISYYRKVAEPNELQRTLGILGRRVYKRITIDRKDSRVIGMSDWSPERREAA